MIPKVAAMGQSFKGAGLYYLHDKEADSAERVAFTHTENLPTDDPEMAMKMMAYTAMQQDRLKALSGAAVTGRKLTKPVYSYSLSWSPDQAPTQEQMIGAAKETLAVLGLQDHEVLMVGHSDTAHPHIHVIVNRVHPETGLAATLSKDHLKLSKWAEEYERRNGQILCDQRVENNRRRAQGQFVKYDRALDAAAFHRWRKARVKAAFGQRQAEKEALAATHKGERETLYDQKENRILAARQALKEKCRPQWAALFAAQKAEKEVLQKRQGSAAGRLFSSPEARSLRLLALENQHEKQRETLKQENAAQLKKEIALINKNYKISLRKLQNTQRIETQAIAEKHSLQSQNLARAITDGSDITAYRQQGKSSEAAAAPPVAAAPHISAPPDPHMAFSPPVGAAYEERKKRTLEQKMSQRLTAQLHALRAETRPQWAALFRRQREELKDFHKASHAALPRVLYHLRHRPKTGKNPVPGAVRALADGKQDLRALTRRHEKERKNLARTIGKQRRATEDQIIRDHQNELTRLETELAREAAAYKKAVQEGHIHAPAPDALAPGVTPTPEDFARTMRTLIDTDKKRDQEERRRRGRDSGGRGRGE